MEKFGVTKASENAIRKVNYFKSVPKQFFIYSLMAGVFCGLGMILAYSAGGSVMASEYTASFARIIFSVSFPLSFTLIVFAGSELFTGNVCTMSIGMLNKAVSVKDGIGLLLFVYIANFVGATLIALIIAASGSLENPLTANYIVDSCAIKMNLPFVQAFFRGFLCNVMVVLAVWIFPKMDSIPGKLIIIMWAVYTFCACGFEHSIANMALFIMGMLSPFTTEEITFLGYINNMIPVTLGNILGGFAIAWVYYSVGNEKINS